MTSLLFDPALTPVLLLALLALVVAYAARPVLVPAYAVVTVTARDRSRRPAYVRHTDPTAAGCHLARAPARRPPAA